MDPDNDAFGQGFSRDLRDTGNVDSHAKNYALTIDAAGFRFGPLYDPMCGATWGSRPYAPCPPGIAPYLASHATK
jgi:hypothetical protein